MHPSHTDMECRHPSHPKNNTRSLKLKKQAREVCEPANTHEGPPVEQETNEHNEDHGTYNPCTYILISGAHPSHLQHPTGQMTKTRTNLHTQTAINTLSTYAQNGQRTILTNRNGPLQIPALANPNIRSNLISMHDIVRLYGNIVFRATQRIIYCNQQGQNTILGTVSWKEGHQAYTWTKT